MGHSLFDLLEAKEPATRFDLGYIKRLGLPARKGTLKAPVVVRAVSKATSRMAQITEITWLPLRADAKDSEASSSLKSLAPEMRSRPGLELSWQGATLERPNSLDNINVWASEEAYRASLSTDLHKQATALVTSLIDTDAAATGAVPYHNLLTLHKPAQTVLVAPVVQITNIFLPSDVDKEAFEAVWEDLVAHMRANPPEGFIAGAHGWGLEEVNGAKVFTALSGWESIESNVKGEGSVSDKFAGVLKFTNVFHVYLTRPLS